MALVQGLTEFLPISSSAHLVLTSRWLGWEDQGLAFDMAVHAGSLVAICAVVRRELGAMARALARPLRRSPDRRLALQLVVATLPVAAVGLVAADRVDEALREVWVIALTSILFGLLLGWADRLAGRFPGGLLDISWGAIVLIGLAQALAVVPGTSRSGVTMTVALALGLSRPIAARLSFLLAVPVMGLVAVHSAVDLVVRPPGSPDPRLVVLGFAVSALTAYAAARWLLAWLARSDMRPFVVYRVILGAGILIWYWS